MLLLWPLEIATKIQFTGTMVFPYRKPGSIWDPASRKWSYCLHGTLWQRPPLTTHCPATSLSLSYPFFLPRPLAARSCYSLAGLCFCSPVADLLPEFFVWGSPILSLTPPSQLTSADAHRLLSKVPAAPGDVGDCKQVLLLSLLKPIVLWWSLYTKIAPILSVHFSEFWQVYIHPCKCHPIRK